MKHTFETNLPSQSRDPKHEIIVVVITKEDVVVGKIKGVDSAELVEPKKDDKRKKHDVRNFTLSHPPFDKLDSLYVLANSVPDIF